MVALAASAAAQPINECGTFMRRPTCLLFQADSGPLWMMMGVGTVEDGSRARIQGELTTSCVSGCPLSQGCVLNALIFPCPPTPTCRADFNRSGDISVQDLFEFLAAFFAQTLGPSPPGGDFDQSGTVSVDDLFSFLAAWFAGCP